MTPLSLGIFASANTTVGTSFESIATLSPSGTSSVTFSSIPSTYTHLQIRAIARTSRSSYTVDGLYIRFNSDTGTNYSGHVLAGDGGAVFAYSSVSGTSGYAGIAAGTNATASTFSASVIDILDYTNTNKYKTVRTLTGFSNNASGDEIDFTSASWRSFNAITSITLISETNSNYLANSHFALYGIKSA